MSDRPIVIFGAGELAELAAFYFRKESERSVAGFTVDGARMDRDRFADGPVVAFEEVTKAFPPETHDIFVAIGYSKINAVRAAKCEAARQAGYPLTSYVSKRATIFSNVQIGWNAFILEDNTLQPFVRVGNGVVLWSGNHVGHHSVIGDYVFVASHVVISGGVKIGARTFMGVNSTTNDHITIGERCVVGSGALITKDAADESVFVATPAELSRVPSSRLRGL